MRRPKNNTYISGKIVPNFSSEAAEIKFKSNIVKNTFNPTFDEGFTIPDCNVSCSFVM